jgi:hypothetical protein
MLELLVARGADFRSWMYQRRPLPMLWSLLGAPELGDGLHGYNIIDMPLEKFSDEELQRARELFHDMSVWRGPASESVCTEGEPPPKRN